MSIEHDSHADEIKDFWREAAKEQRSAILEIKGSYQNEVNALSRWLTASLLAINSGAIVAVLNAKTLAPIIKIYSGASFTVGIILALLVAYTNLKLAHQIAPEFEKHLGYWISVNLDGERDEEIEDELAEGWKKSSKWRLVPDLIGWASLISFVIGLTLVGNGLIAMKADVFTITEANASGESL